MNYEATLNFARQLDEDDSIHRYRDRFHMHQLNGKNV